MNVSDSERVATVLSAQGYQMTADESSADLVLINTCSVREKAEHKLYSRVGRIRHADGPKPLIGVLGCVAQLEGETLFKKIEGIDFVLGTKAVGRVAAAIDHVVANGSGYADLGERDPDYEWNVSDAQRHSPYVAFVPIIEGCNKFCTYCIVPFARGREVSLPASTIIRNIVKLRQSGVKEIHLIGQNVNSYRPLADEGLGGFSGKTPFARLLRAVAATGFERIKFNTSFPRDFHPDIVDAIEENENLCNWVHLPVQSGSDKVLRSMRRGHTVDSYLKKIDRLRISKRDIALSTDIIVGFPGETDKDFRDTVKMAEYCGFDSAYIFKYSARPGTPAFAMNDDVAPTLKTVRFLELESVIRRRQSEVLQRYSASTLKVLAEKSSAKSENDLTGHSTCHKVVNFQGPHELLGSVVDVSITDIRSNSLFGKVC